MPRSFDYVMRPANLPLAYGLAFWSFEVGASVFNAEIYCKHQHFAKTFTQPEVHEVLDSVPISQCVEHLLGRWIDSILVQNLCECANSARMPIVNSSCTPVG